MEGRDPSFLPPGDTLPSALRSDLCSSFNTQVSQRSALQDEKLEWRIPFPSWGPSEASANRAVLQIIHVAPGLGELPTAFPVLTTRTASLLYWLPTPAPSALCSGIPRRGRGHCHSLSVSQHSPLGFMYACMKGGEGYPKTSCFLPPN